MNTETHGYTTSGTPVTDELLEKLADEAEHGYDVVQPVTTANETLVFALPREIRQPRSS